MKIKIINPGKIEYKQRRQFQNKKKIISFGLCLFPKLSSVSQ